MYTYYFRTDAEGILTTAQEFLNTLEKSEAVQDKINTAIENANSNVDEARLDLTRVNSYTVLCFLR